MLAGGASGGCRAAVISVSVAMLSCAAARADSPPEVTLTWNVAAGCPDRAMALAVIRDFLQRRSAQIAPAAEAGVTIVRRPDAAFQATILLRDESGSGERYFESQSCERVAEAAALIIAMTLESTTAVERLTVEPAAPPRAAPDPRPDERLRFSIGARAAADLGSLPQLSLAVGLVVSAGLGAFRAGADVSVWLPRAAASGASSGSAVEVGLVAAAVRGCYLFIQSGGHSLGFGPCLGAEAGTSAAQGIRVANDGPHRTLWAAALAGLTLRQFGGSPVGTWLSLEAGFPWLRPNYVIVDAEGHAVRVFHAAPVVARASFGIGWSF